MQKRLVMAMIMILVLLVMGNAWAANIEYLTAKPMSQAVSAQVKPYVGSGPIPIPIITWGADTQTILAKNAGYFDQGGLNVSIVKEDNFVKQVEDCLSGKTPYIRGTMGMVTAAADAFKAKGVELVVIYQLSWSNGGDTIVIKKGKKLDNIRTVALQLYGPHMDYASNLFQKVNRLSDVKFKWLAELTTTTTPGPMNNPVSVFRSDSSIDAAMVLSNPDAFILTSGGQEGKGGEGSVIGAKILLSTKTASRIIADVYAVRKDYFDSNREAVQSFVKALMKGQESLIDMRKSKTPEFRQLMTKAGEIFSMSASDTEALLGDCEFVFHAGNVSFFTGQGTTRNFNTLSREIQGYFQQIGILSGGVTLAAASWDYQGLASGLKYAAGATVTAKVTPVKKFDTARVAAKVEKTIASIEPNTWEEEDTLFVVEIYFEPNQGDFPVEKYQDDFQKALEIAQTYSGAIVIIEGHADPQKILQAEKDKTRYKQIDLEQMKQTAKNLSLQRAEAVRQSFLEFCSDNGIALDDSQFVPVGLGVSSPKFSPPRTKDEWSANRRVVFRIKQIEAELDEFRPIE